MNINEIIFDKKSDQFDKRRLLNKFVLNEKNCKIGDVVRCCELEVIFSNGSYYHFKKLNKIKKIKTLTLGKGYQIIDINDCQQIKIKNDKNNCVWCSMKRFVVDIKYQRKIKIEKINEQVYL